MWEWCVEPRQCLFLYQDILFGLASMDNIKSEYSQNLEPTSWATKVSLLDKDRPNWTGPGGKWRKMGKDMKNDFERSATKNVKFIMPTLYLCNEILFCEYSLVFHFFLQAKQATGFNLIVKNTTGSTCKFFCDHLSTYQTRDQQTGLR